MNDILFEKRGSIGLVTLNRVKPLNALTHEMIKALADQLDAWKTDPDVAAVVLTSASERAFSAGADIRAIYQSRMNPPLDFFRDEYRMNCEIFSYPKPYVSLAEGILMGGGVGISVHGSHVAAGEAVKFAMPETGIGLFPDIGGSYFLSRMPGFLGTYCALTGARLNQRDCFAAGLVTHTMKSKHFSEIVEKLAEGAEPTTLLNAYVEDAIAPSLDAEKRDMIEEVFSANSVLEVMDRLERHNSDFAAETLALLRSRSPLSVHIAFEQVIRGIDMGFNDCMAMEFRIVERVIRGDEFYEGVRATIIDKDGAPRWQPSEFDQVTPDLLQSFFSPLENVPELFD
ncbi:enoyl-CoA hydratase/isomerase family protein [uncultured Cohaesibacter sp.]|uniref:enoyl-CoA hydratase/isomerase family protein n=1 Tax=uncultured Cohaesibacter sp. TaxID=1002546 RepID=UPI00292E6343|nr:enoyl-CoA hydratase/isomerase family protein [uncultured Cohaesibacter sp.]